jgi:hypothetical protein
MIIGVMVTLAVALLVLAIVGVQRIGLRHQP